MARQRIGTVEFQDLQLGTRAQVVITRTPEDKRTNLFLDLDVAGRGVEGAGDCEIGLDNENVRQVLTLLRQVLAVPRKESLSWEAVGRAEFSWSDKSRSGEDSGPVLVESNGVAARMVIQTKGASAAPYVATFGPATVNELSTLLSRALAEA